MHIISKTPGVSGHFTRIISDIILKLFMNPCKLHVCEMMNTFKVKNILLTLKIYPNFVSISCILGEQEFRMINNVTQ